MEKRFSAIVVLFGFVLPDMEDSNESFFSVPARLQSDYSHYCGLFADHVLKYSYCMKNNI